jgi:hypothetical protein
VISVGFVVSNWTDVERARKSIVRHLLENPGGISTSELRRLTRPDGVSAGYCSAALRTLTEDGSITFAHGPKNARYWRLTSLGAVSRASQDPETDTESGRSVCLTSDDPDARESPSGASELEITEVHGARANV